MQHTRIARLCADIYIYIYITCILILLFLLLVWSEDDESCCGNKSILNKGFDRRKLVRHVSQKLSGAELGLHTLAPLVVSLFSLDLISSFLLLRYFPLRIPSPHKVIVDDGMESNNMYATCLCFYRQWLYKNEWNVSMLDILYNNIHS